MKKNFFNVDIKKCFDHSINRDVNDDFINCISKNSNNKKVIGTVPNKPSKEVEDELTNITNNLLIENQDFTNRFFEAVYTNFGGIDNDNLTPYETKNEKINNDMYFVFKGGNTIKLWVNKFYLKKMKKLTANLQDILSNKIPDTFHENGAINASSDFDFSLYINFKKLKPDYGKILKDIGNKMLLLRDDINNIIDDKQIANYNSKKLLNEIYKYIQLINSERNNIRNIQLNFPKSGNDFILTKKQYIHKPIIFNRLVNNKHFVSFNNIIQKQEDNNLDDFDLFRIKLGIVAKYEYDYNDEDNSRPLKSEVFDLSILRNTDPKLQKMCDHIDEYTKIIPVKFNNKIIPIRLYNIKYLIIDLLRMLFATIPWLDIKYGKRLIRLAILTSLYNQEQFSDNPREFGIGLFIIFNILNIIYFFEKLDKDVDVTSNIKIFKYIIEHNLNTINNSDSLQNLVKNTLTPQLNKIINGEPGYDDLKYYIDNYLYLNKPNQFLCLILLVFIRKIIIESNEEWYLRIIKDPTLSPYNDFFEIKFLLMKLLKTYIFHILNTTIILTDLKTVLQKYFGEEILNNIKQDLYDSIQRGGGSNPQNESIQNMLSVTNIEPTLQKTFEDEMSNSGSRYTLQKLESEQLEELEKEQIKIKIKENSIYYLSKLYKINDYFEDVNHPYLLNSDMQPEIIRKIKNEENITNVFNILKDILQLN